MLLPHLDTAFEVKLLAETGVFEGYASVFGVTDTVNDRIASGAFRACLDACLVDGRLPPLLWQHDPKQPIGVWREMREDAHGLHVRGELFINDIPRAREAYKLLRENVVTGLSIGYRAKQSHHEDGCRVLTDIDLVEVSIVTFPANDCARVRRVKSVLEQGGVPSQKEFEALLRDAGMSRKQAKGVIAQGYKSLSLRDADDGDDTDICGEIFALAEIIRKAAPNN